MPEKKIMDFSGWETQERRNLARLIRKGGYWNYADEFEIDFSKIPKQRRITIAEDVYYGKRVPKEFFKYIASKTMKLKKVS